MNDVAPRPDMPRPDHLLHAGETAIWWDRPNLLADVTMSLILAALALIVTVIAVFMVWISFTSSGSIGAKGGEMLVVSVIAALIAPCLLFFVLYDIVQSFRTYGNTIYLLTNQRLIVAHKADVKVMPIAQATRLRSASLFWGYGSVNFFIEKNAAPTPAASVTAAVDAGGHPPDVVPPTPEMDRVEGGFISIRNFEAVEAMIRTRQAVA